MDLAQLTSLGLLIPARVLDEHTAASDVTNATSDATHAAGLILKGTSQARALQTDKRLSTDGKSQDVADLGQRTAEQIAAIFEARRRELMPRFTAAIDSAALSYRPNPSDLVNDRMRPVMTADGDMVKTPDTPIDHFGATDLALLVNHTRDRLLELADDVLGSVLRRAHNGSDNELDAVTVYSVQRLVPWERATIEARALVNLSELHRAWRARRNPKAAALVTTLRGLLDLAARNCAQARTALGTALNIPRPDPTGAIDTVLDSISRDLANAA